MGDVLLGEFLRCSVFATYVRQGRELINSSNRTSMRLYAILVMGFERCRLITPRNSYVPLLHHHLPSITITAVATIVLPPHLISSSRSTPVPRRSPPFPPRRQIRPPTLYRPDRKMSHLEAERGDGRPGGFGQAGRG